MQYLLLLLLLTSNTFAKGYYCSALCISVDGYSHAVDVVGEVDIEAGLDKPYQVHRILKKICRDKFYDQSGILVDELKYKGSVDTYETSSEVYKEHYYDNGWTLLSGYYLRSYGASSENRTLDISILRSKPSFACELDNEIPTGWIPYTGSIPVQ